ncbi:MAG: FUSC family protein [Verrucomicrobia bacterium]|nr:FUSC family protein [Verrucomicrobiota bacterium]
MGGSIGGGIIAAAAPFVLHNAMEITLVIMPLSILSMALRWASYALYVLCITPLFILMTELLNQGGLLKPELGGVSSTLYILSDSLRSPLRKIYKARNRS